MATCSVKGQAASFLRYRHAVVSYFSSLRLLGALRPLRRLGRLLISTISAVSMAFILLRCAMWRAWVSARYINKGRSPQNCIERGYVSVKYADAILRDDVYINKHVTPRRGTYKGGVSGELPCPDVGVFRCFTSSQSGYTLLRGAVGISKVTSTMVDRHRIAWSVVAYQ